MSTPRNNRNRKVSTMVKTPQTDPIPKTVGVQHKGAANTALSTSYAIDPREYVGKRFQSGKKRPDKNKVLLESTRQGGKPPPTPHASRGNTENESIELNAHLVSPAPFERLSGQQPDISHMCVPFMEFHDIPTLEDDASSSVDDSDDDNGIPELLAPDENSSSDE